MRNLGCLLSLLFATAVFAIDPAGDPLAHLRPGHPRLLLTDEQLKAAILSARTDPLRADLQKHIIATAEAILTAPPIRHNDGKSAQEQERYAVYYIVSEAMAYRLTGDDRFLKRAKSDLLTVAAFPDWNPRQDLSEGEMSFAVAIGYDWLYAKLSPDERATIQKALVEKSLSFADNSYRRGGGWTVRHGNHNQVCNGGLVTAALALADEQPDLARRIIAGASVSMRYALADYAPDGADPEGPGYWTYGTTYSVITFAGLESALGTDLGFAATPGFANTIDYYEAMEGPFGPVFNYADATDDLQISPARTWLAKKYNSPFALQHVRSQLADFLRQNSVARFDRGIQATVVNRFFALHEVWFPDKPAGVVTNLPLDFHFRGPAEIATFRSAWNDTNAIFLGVKAGENGRGHRHLDLGSFVLDADGQRWAMDLGPDNVGGTYTRPGYFDFNGRRWTYFRTNNHGHNTVTPGDALQARRGVAPITRFGTAPGRAFAVVDLTPAYPEQAAGLHRGIALLDRARVLVQDEYQPSQTNLPLHWLMITRAAIDLAADGRSATLTSGGRKLRVDLLEPTSAKLRIDSTRPANADEMQNEDTSALATDIDPEGSEKVTRMAVLLKPVGERWPTIEPPTLKPLDQWP
ncbi:MAG TPA: heparinase II/III family protein [Verrucomicrobiae bacterium]|nr:heparinase II/III family protein [Verrucomicrobiae bacterium]